MAQTDGTSTALPIPSCIDCSFVPLSFSVIVGKHPVPDWVGRPQWGTSGYVCFALASKAPWPRSSRRPQGHGSGPSWPARCRYSTVRMSFVPRRRILTCPGFNHPGCYTCKLPCPKYLCDRIHWNVIKSAAGETMHTPTSESQGTYGLATRPCAFDASESVRGIVGPDPYESRADSPCGCQY